MKKIFLLCLFLVVCTRHRHGRNYRCSTNASQYQHARFRPDWRQRGDWRLLCRRTPEEPKSVMIRALGPELTQYGILNALANPTLELYDGTGALIASNNNWVTTIIGGIITASQVHEIQTSGYAPADPYRVGDHRRSTKGQLHRDRPCGKQPYRSCHLGSVRS